MKSIRWTTVALALFIVAVLLTGACSQPAPSPTSSPAPTSAPSPKPTSTPTPSPTSTPTASAPAEKFELKFATYMTPTHYLNTGGMNVFFQELETKSNGRIKVTPFYSESLGKAADQYDMISKGIADLSWVNPSYTPGRFPLTDILNMSFAYKTAVQGNAVAAKMTPILAREFPDVKLLAIGQSLPYPLGFRTKRVATLEDLKGLKIRSTAGLMSDTMTLLGAVPVAMAAGEMYTAMQRGTVDGILLSFSSFPDYKIDEVSKFGLDCGGLGSPAIIWPMNKAKFDRMPADLQKIVTDAAAKLPGTVGEVWDAQDIKVRKQLEAKGIEIVYMPDAEIARWKDKVKPISDKWLADVKKLGLPGDDVMAAFNKAIAETKK